MLGAYRLGSGMGYNGLVRLENLDVPQRCGRIIIKGDFEYGIIQFKACMAG
jgi:hypothetical protein